MSASRESCTMNSARCSRPQSSTLHAPSQTGHRCGRCAGTSGHLTATLNAGIALKRRIIEDLRPSTLSKLGLVPRWRSCCGSSASAGGVMVVSNLEPVSLPPDHELTIYRVVQEALTNTAKYANASSVTVTLHQYRNTWS